MQKSIRRRKQTRRRERGWVSDRLWTQVRAGMPIACVDVIIAESRGAVLLGWRTIHPYVNVWALPGGRVRMGEDLTTAARRILSTHNIRANDFYLVGVFPVRFPSRFDLSICVAAKNYSGTPVPDGTEFTKVRWFSTLPNGIGKNYRKMIEKWRRIRHMPQVTRLNQI
jgi:ADP-ribose pyrophosphatase YjhB (NUDIX family)